MPRLPFQTALLLAPLAYALHHIEENVVLDFRVWRLSYFPDNNGLTTEAMLATVMAVTFGYLILNSVFRNRVSAAMMIGFLMGSQVCNTIFHVVGTIVFNDYSPGTVTGLLLYLPVNFLICRAALREELATPKILFLVFLLGGGVFLLFEVFGPLVMPISPIATWLVMIGWGIKTGSSHHDLSYQITASSDRATTAEVQG